MSGMAHGARVITAAALIMISVFAGFVLSGDTVIKSLGFVLAYRLGGSSGPRGQFTARSIECPGAGSG